MAIKNNSEQTEWLLTGIGLPGSFKTGMYEDKDFKQTLKSMFNTVQEAFLVRAGLPMGRQTHGAGKSRRKWLTVLKMREYSNGMKTINTHETSSCSRK